MINYEILNRALNSSPHATFPAKMSGGDLPKYDADMESYDKRTIFNNPYYKSMDMGDINGEVET